MSKTDYQVIHYKDNNTAEVIPPRDGFKLTENVSWDALDLARLPDVGIVLYVVRRAGRQDETVTISS